MPKAMRECKDTGQRAAFLMAYRNAIKRDTPESIALETLSSNIGYLADNGALPMSWADAVRMAFPKEARTLLANAVAHENDYGRKITDNVLKMIAAADKTQRQRYCTMNDYLFIANPGDTIDDVCAGFFIDGMISSFRIYARRRFEREFAQIGGKIFDLIADRDG
jgi:hypothetical protein